MSGAAATGAAAPLLRDRRYEATTLRDIAEQAGIKADTSRRSLPWLPEGEAA